MIGYDMTIRHVRIRHGKLRYDIRHDRIREGTVIRSRVSGLLPPHSFRLTAVRSSSIGSTEPCSDTEPG